MRIEDVPKFRSSSHTAWRRRLFALNIRHVEQLGSLLAAPEGRVALKRLGTPLESVQAAVEPVLRMRLGLSLDRPLSANDSGSPLLTRDRHPMGHRLGESDRFRDLPFDSPFPKLNSQAAKRSTIFGDAVLGPPNTLTAFDQGRRGTCVAFTVMAMYQGMRVRAGLRPLRLSTQYLYWRTKVADTVHPHEEGSSLDAALQTLQREGCCLEHQLEYSGRHDITQAYRIKGHTPRMSPLELKKLARRQRIVGYRDVPATVAAIKAELAQARPVGVGLAMYHLAWYNALARSQGEIALPVLEIGAKSDTLLDTYLGGHAVALMGYRDNAGDEEDSRPGGGYFIFRNSWGEEWAPHNDDAPGYGYLPYEYVSRFCVEAAVIDDLPPPAIATNGSSPSKLSDPPASSHKPAPSHKGTARAKRRNEGATKVRRRSAKRKQR